MELFLSNYGLTTGRDFLFLLFLSLTLVSIPQRNPPPNREARSANYAQDSLLWFLDTRMRGGSC